MNDERFIAIETKIAHQEILIEELNQVIYEQQKSLDILEAQLKRLTARVLEGTEDIGPANQKAPHY